MSTHDYVPSRDKDFHDWFDNLLKYVLNKTGGQDGGVWNYIPLSQVNALNESFADWSTHYIPTLEPHTPGQTQGKNDARRRAEAVIREFVQRFLHWDPVTNEDRVNMGLPNRDVVRTDHTVVLELVDFVIHLRGIRELVVDFWILGSSSKAKPAGYDGAVIVWDVLDAAPERPESLNRHTMASRSSFAINFDETERGKTAFIALAWQNERGILGAWSEVKSAIVP